MALLYLDIFPAFPTHHGQTSVKTVTQGSSGMFYAIASYRTWSALPISRLPLGLDFRLK
ncbi:MAG: hypothetical protein F6K56_11220 [Moorea sp. SIO3G5]|nr:hypothetical protein [Moorena sp. SIO3G5]